MPSLEVQFAREELRLRQLALHLTGSKKAAAELLQTGESQWNRAVGALRRKAGQTEPEAP